VNANLEPFSRGGPHGEAVAGHSFDGAGELEPFPGRQLRMDHPRQARRQNRDNDQRRREDLRHGGFSGIIPDGRPYRTPPHPVMQPHRPAFRTSQGKTVFPAALAREERARRLLDP
jgi:hypothetical protein